MTTLRYWAAAKAAAGTGEEARTAATLAELLAAAVADHGPALERVLGVCSFVVDGAPVGERPHDAVDVSGADLVDVLPPFAGG